MRTEGESGVGCHTKSAHCCGYSLNSKRRTFTMDFAASGAFEDLQLAAEDWASANGLLVRREGGFQTCPITLIPSIFPRQTYEEAIALQPIFNRLVDRVSRDLSWLYKELEATGAGDDFIQAQLEICKQVHGAQARGKNEKFQTTYLGCNRSDYMIHCAPETEKDVPILPAASGTPQGSFLQVELNTIASSFGSLSTQTSALHKFLCTRHRDSVESAYAKLGLNVPPLTPENLPETNTVNVLCQGMAEAFKHYQMQRGTDCVVRMLYIIFVVSDGEKNSVDQRMLEYELWNTHQIPVLRHSLTTLATNATIENRGGAPVLFVDGGTKEIAVVYYRDGYSPDAYPTKKEWDARLLMEKSYAIKCPSITYQLVGAKKIQQALAGEGVLEKYLSATDAIAIRKSFAGLYELTDEAVAAAMAHPEHFVLKPQREGGGNNVYGEDITKVLPSLSSTERAAYILMQRIFPPGQDSLLLLRGGLLMPCKALSELGVYGAFLGDEEEEHLNLTGGHLLRTKPDSSDEGGVAAGFAVIDSPCLL